jgi:precorrin-2 dehydrogenase / sirohydrochlorin ferrochelatase
MIFFNSSIHQTIAIMRDTSSSKTTNELFPVFLKLNQLHTLVVGGGFVGWEKLGAILGNSPKAQITLVSPEIRDEIYELIDGNENVMVEKRVFQESDLLDKDLVIAATNDKSVNQLISKLAKKRRLLCNVADTPPFCDFYLSSIVQKGNLKVAISTNGASPTVAKRLKEVLNETLSETDINDLLVNIQAIRQRLGGDFQDKVEKLNAITAILIEK